MKIKILSVNESNASMLVSFYPDDVEMKGGEPAWDVRLNYTIPTDADGAPMEGQALLAWLAVHRPIAEMALQEKRRSGAPVDFSGVVATIGTEAQVDDQSPAMETGIATEPSLDAIVPVL